MKMKISDNFQGNSSVFCGFRSGT